MAGHERRTSKKTLMKNQIQIEEQAPANANQLTSNAKGTLAKPASDRMAKLGEFRILTLREMPAYGKAENPEHSADYWRKHIDTDPRHNPDVESLVCLVLNTRREILGHFLVATGLLDTILCHPREVFRPAIVANAAAIVLSRRRGSTSNAPHARRVGFSCSRIGPAGNDSRQSGSRLNGTLNPDFTRFNREDRQSLFYARQRAHDFFCPDSWNSHDEKAHTIKVLLHPGPNIDDQ